jgi:ribosomal protein L31E
MRGPAKYHGHGSENQAAIQIRLLSAQAKLRRARLLVSVPSEADTDGILIHTQIRIPAARSRRNRVDSVYSLLKGMHERKVDFFTTCQVPASAKMQVILYNRGSEQVEKRLRVVEGDASVIVTSAQRQLGVHVVRQYRF